MHGLLLTDIYYTLAILMLGMQNCSFAGAKLQFDTPKSKHLTECSILCIVYKTKR